ncbi:MAG: tyrosine-type recombinase/integrase [Candidatus Bathyarchaeia archaeon]
MYKISGYLAEKEIERMLRQKIKTDLETQTAVAMIARCGLSLEELCYLRIEDIDFNHSRMFVRGTRGNGLRETPIDGRTMEIIRTYIGSDTHGFLLDRRKRAKGHQVEKFIKTCSKRIQRKVKQRGRKVGLARKATPLMLRHSFGVSALRAGMNPLTVKAILGLRSFKMIQIYLAEIAPEMDIDYHKHPLPY